MYNSFVVEQSCGHDVMYREKFDVAIARAVAEMRVLGNLLQVSSRVVLELRNIGA